MKTLIVLGTIALAIGLIAVGAWAGTAWAQDRWESNMMGYGASGYDTMGSGMMGYGVSDYGTMGPGMMGYGAAGYGHGMMGPGRMGANWDWDEMPFGSAQDMPCSGAYTTPGKGEISSLEEVETVVRDYVERLGYTGLEVTEVMEFERNYYAIVVEQDTGVGAMELLVDKDSGVVGPEPGPNMMWNAKYGMMGRGGGMMGMRGPELGEGMGGNASGEMTLSPQEAEDVAQRWLDANLPGRTAGEADEFYGYYTLHFLNDGQIEGMLSVHGSSGEVWYHSWHGDFVAMSESHG
jgi:hypothetical protein